jgi:hypothetical protein
MTTDKVRVRIWDKGTFIDAQIKWLGSWNILETIKAEMIFKDHDNWIDITLPEAIDRAYKWGVRIWYDNAWKAEMYKNDKSSKFEEDAMFFENWELPVTVY